MSQQYPMWNREAETMPVAQLRQMQVERLRAKVTQVYERVPFYRQKFDQAGVKPEQIKSLDDLRRLPFTVKQDLRDNYPFGMLAVPMSDVVRIHATSGTTGKPITVVYTKNDLDMWAEVIARTLGAGGVTKDDVLQNAYGYGLFTGGLGAHYGAEKIGAAVVPISVGNTKRQIMLIQDFGVTAITCTPSYALYLAESAMEMGVDLRTQSRLRVGFFGAEPWTEAMRAEIEAKLPVKAIDIYGLAEIIGPGVATDCTEQCGLHVFEDHFYPEIIDPETGESLPDGERGELVFTTLTKEALPLIRYRTRDITRLHSEQCKCGRTLRRIEKLQGRSDDMLIIRGINVFPSSVEAVLLQIDGVEPHYQLVVDRKRNLDTLEVWVEVSASTFSDEIARLEALEKKVAAALNSALSIDAKVKLVEPKSIQRSEGKAKRIIDKREL